MAKVTVKEAVSPLQAKIRRRLRWFLGLNFLAILVTGYLVYLHYKPTASTLCKINEYFDCDIVNKSIYSEIFGVPVAILGLLTYLFLFGMAWVIYKNIRLTRWLWVMFGVTVVGVLFSGYLTYIELFVLYAICIFCLAQQILILIDLFLLLSMLSTIDQGKRGHPDV